MHIGDLALDQAQIVADTLDALCKEGLIRHYGWSTDDPLRGAAFADRPNATAVQFDMNLFEDAPEMLRVCEANRFAGIIRLPLAMGFLTGKYSAASRLPEDDIRSKPPAWLRYFEERGSASKKWRAVLDGVKEILMSNGRTLAQGALGWIWARSACTVPIPGVRTVAHVEENVGAIDFGPLTAVQLSEISALLSNPNELVQSQGASP